MKAIWQNTTIAESNDTVIVEGNHYFPPEAVANEFLKSSEHTTYCPWKGTAHYYSVQVGSQTNDDAAWYYPEPKQAADNIRGYVCFWHGIEVHE